MTPETGGNIGNPDNQSERKFGPLAQSLFSSFVSHGKSIYEPQGVIKYKGEYVVDSSEIPTEIFRLYDLVPSMRPNGRVIVKMVSRRMGDGHYKGTVGLFPNQGAKDGIGVELI